MGSGKENRLGARPMVAGDSVIGMGDPQMAYSCSFRTPSIAASLAAAQWRRDVHFFLQGHPWIERVGGLSAVICFIFKQAVRCIKYIKYIKHIKDIKYTKYIKYKLWKVDIY